jgi:hypothetical protein
MSASSLRATAAALAASLTLPLVVACASTPPPGDASDDTARSVARLHTSKCNACHTAPAPKTRTREHLEDAFTRHKRRVSLTSEEWADLTDYLAMPEGKTARQP